MTYRGGQQRHEQEGDTMPGKPGRPRHPGYPAAQAKRLGELITEDFDASGMSYTELHGRFVVALHQLGQPPKMDERQWKRIKDGKATREQLENGYNIEAAARALQVSPKRKAAYYAAVGSKPPHWTEKHYEQAFELIEELIQREAS
jgi:hypothetical protein